MKDTLITLVLFLSTGATTSPSQAEKFDDGMLKTTTKRCNEAITEQIALTNMCQLHDVCPISKKGNTSRIEELEQYIISHCSAKLLAASGFNHIK